MIKIINGSQLENDLTKMNLKETFGDIIGQVFDAIMADKLQPGMSLSIYKYGNHDADKLDYFGIYFRLPEETEENSEINVIYVGYEKN
ncbi:hypothetical protein FHZ96_07645 [Listeria monocytogenes]|uniref:hypothetical protein n=1 Tax=Listeria monocytogenes TaxID=1639 RepID=UPI000679EF09|nr:hypothetical protein [Listeria monocytogenes]AKS54018.1 hypothetical protein LM850658_07125 [Listeria monocytogenes]EAC4173170.1 hypothetical protein [Listeria monocytogenes]EAC4202979.1 hypothetical protein [Listeria monocytogenes]EAC4316049.1 hypothetical protein [Listeria monocytogenes]EAC9043130.1 hypothetical protein [Listeria monocytogenes]